MAREEEVTESPGGGTTTAPPPSGDGDLDLQSLSCSDLGNLLTIVDNVILLLKRQLDDTSKLRFLARRSIQVSLNTHLALKKGIQDQMDAKGCP
jgi:hypothetical protein